MTIDMNEKTDMNKDYFKNASYGILNPDSEKETFEKIFTSNYWTFSPNDIYHVSILIAESEETLQR